MENLYLTQFGVEIPLGLLCTITTKKEKSFAICDFSGKVNESLHRMTILISELGCGYIAKQHKYEDPKLKEGDKHLWLPIEKESELAFTGETILINDIMYGKIFWD